MLEVRLKKQMSLKHWISSLLFLALSITALLFLLPPDFRKLNDISKVIRGDKGEILRVFLNSKDKFRIPVKYKNLNEDYLEMLIEYEDKRFYKHYGFDLLALGRASFQYIKNGEVLSGASTLTMQLARMLEPKDRTVYSKILEIVKAIQIDLKFSKEEILHFLCLLKLPWKKYLEELQEEPL